jgi:SAM-dependent methyltransferase
MADHDAETPINDFDCIADVYDELVDWAPYESWVAGLEKRLRCWGLKPGDTILDAACGTGLSTLPWVRRGYRVVGTDGSAAMLERARERMRQAAYEVELKLQNLLELDPGRAFDAAVCMHSGLDYILDDADLGRAFRSLRGCLRTGGLLAFDKCLDEPAFYKDDYADRRELSCGSAEFQYRWDRGKRLLEQRCTVYRDPGRGPRRTTVVYHLKAVPADELAAMVERAGFKVLEWPKTFRASDPGMGIFRAV